VFTKKKVAPPLDETTTPQVKKVKLTPQTLPPPTQPRTSKREKKGAQRTKCSTDEQVIVTVVNDPQPAEILPIREQTSTVL